MLKKKQQKVLTEAADFQPDAIVLENQEPPISLHFVWYLVIGAILFLFLWACFSEIDKTVTAEGRIVTIRPPLTMKPYDRTTIRKVHIHLGQRVKKGDLLFTFDQTINQQELNRLKEQLRSYYADKARLQAEMLGYKAEPVFQEKELGFDEKQQLQIYRNRKNYFDQKVTSYNETIHRYESTIHSLEETLQRYKDRQEALAKIESMYRGLHQRKAASLKELLTTQVQVIETGIQLDNQKVAIVENRQNLLSAKAERDAFISDWFRQISEALVNVDRNITTYEREIPKYEMLVGTTEMRSPCDAVIHELAPFQEGSGVREAEALVSLIPIDSSTFIAEIDIPANDISWIKLDDKCRIKFDAFPFQQCGTLEGTIFYISQDAFKHDGSGQQIINDDGGRQSAAARGVSYQARLKLSGKLTGRAEKAELLPGMRIKAEICVGKRRVISYIFNPFIKALDEAIREP